MLNNERLVAICPLELDLWTRTRTYKCHPECIDAPVLSWYWVVVAYSHGALFRAVNANDKWSVHFWSEKIERCSFRLCLFDNSHFWNYIFLCLFELRCFWAQLNGVVSRGWLLPASSSILCSAALTRPSCLSNMDLSYAWNLRGVCSDWPLSELCLAFLTLCVRWLHFPF